MSRPLFPAGSWVCRCGTINQDDYDRCWKCNRTGPGVTPAGVPVRLILFLALFVCAVFLALAVLTASLMAAR